MEGGPFLFPKGGYAVSAAASVGDGRSPLATIAPLHSPTGERSHLPVRSALGKRHRRLTPPPYPLLRGVNFYLAASFADAKLDRASRTAVRLGSCAHPPRKGPLSSGLPQKGFQRGMKSRLPARSAMDGRHWRPSPPFEMRCIELSSPPVAARLPLLENEINGRGQGVGSLPCVVFSKGDSPPLKNSQPGPCRVNRTKCNLTRSH